MTLGHFWLHSYKKNTSLAQAEFKVPIQPAAPASSVYLITLIRRLRQLSTWCASLGSALRGKPHYCYNHGLLGERENSIYHFTGPPDSIKSTINRSFIKSAPRENILRDGWGILLSHIHPQPPQSLNDSPSPHCWLVTNIDWAFWAKSPLWAH